MAIVPVDVGAAPTGAGGDTTRDAFLKLNASVADLDQRASGVDGEDGVGVPAGGAIGQVLTKASVTDYDTAWQTPAASLLEAVAGGEGFVDAMGAVTLDLATGRTFYLYVLGNITSWAFTNVPNLEASSINVRVVFLQDATGGRLISGGPAIAFRDGRSMADINTEPNAENELVLWTVGTAWRGALVWNGDLERDPYKVAFLDNGTIPIVTEAESIDLANYSRPTGDGAITFNKNGGAAITTRTTFAEGDILNVICAGQTTVSSVRIPRFAL